MRILRASLALRRNADRSLFSFRSRGRRHLSDQGLFSSFCGAALFLPAAGQLDSYSCVARFHVAHAANMPGNIHTIPLTVIASWPTPNYIDPERRPWMPEFAGILTAVSSLMVVTRLWLRTRKQAGALGLDDVGVAKPIRLV